MVATSKSNKQRAAAPDPAGGNLKEGGVSSADINRTVKIGRPTRFTPDQLSDLLDQYIAHCKDNGEPILITSFAIYIKADRSTLQDYADMEQFSPIIKRLEDACEDCAARYLYSGKNPAGVIFYLKNKHGWTDKQEINVNNRLTIDVAPATLEQCRAAVQLRERFEQACLDVPGEVIEAKTEPI
jgi:hypothetical protein